MPRTVPTIADPPAGDKFVSLSLIDVSGDRKAVSFEVSDAATSVQIEAFVAALATATNANIWEARITQRLTSPAKSTDAVAAEENSVQDAIVVHAKDALNNSFRFWIPAPIRGLFSGATDNPDAADADLLLCLTTFQTLTNSSGITARFNERVEKNEAVSF